MSGTTDEAKGRAKEAVGDLAGDEDLKREGQADRAAGDLKKKVGEAQDWAEDKVDDLKDKAT